MRSDLTELVDVMDYLILVLFTFDASAPSGYTIQVQLSHSPTDHQHDTSNDVKHCTEAPDRQSRRAQDRGEMAQDGEDQLERSRWQGGQLSCHHSVDCKLISREYGSVPIDLRDPKLVSIVRAVQQRHLMISGPYSGFITSSFQTCFDNHH